MKRLYYFLIIFTLFTKQVNASEIKCDEFFSEITDLAQKKKISALAIAIVNDKEIICKKFIGKTKKNGKISKQ